MLENQLDSLFSNWKSSKNRNQEQLDLFLISVDMKGNNIICINNISFTKFRDLSGSCRKKAYSIFGFSIAYYGMIIGAAILIGFLIATVEAKRTGQNPEDYLDMGIVGVIAGIAGARIYYVIFSWDLYKDNLLSIFNLREGGLAIYGGVIGAVIAVFVMAAVKKKSPFQILDTIALALLNGQMLGRWGNFFNREAFGEYTDCLFAMRLPVDAVRPEDITELMRENMQRIDGVSYIQVHPTFLMNHYGVPDCLLYCFCIGNIRNMKVSSFLCTCLVMGQDACGSRGLERISLFFRGSDFRCQNFWQVVW